jgi:hypothetical protein
MIYVIIYKSTGKRVRQKGVLTPVFDYNIQAQKYIENYMGNSPYVTWKRVR